MLTTTSEHAIRALVCLARLSPDGPVLLRDLAECAQVPPSYLSKILGALARAGILQATRGVNGGYRLRRPPREIKLLELVETFDGPQREHSCIFSKLHPCSDDDPCPAHADWKKVRTAYLAFLEKKTVADLAGPLAKSADGAKGARPARKKPAKPRGGGWL